MRKNFGAKTWLYPMPVLIIGTYDVDGTPNAMNAAWGGIYDTNKIGICLSDDHKTTENIRLKGAFTVAVADVKNVVGADYVGLVSGNDVPEKTARAGFTSEKSAFVDAPVFTNFPMSLECRLEKINEDGFVVGEIVNVSADESVLGSDGKIDVRLVRAVTYDSVHHQYIELGEKAGNAFSDGNKLKG